MTKLEAVNMLLRLIGASPVNGLNTELPDAVNAKVTLDRVARLSQRTGWWFNVEYNTTLDPVDGKITLTDDITSIVLNDINYVARGNRIYNRVLNTYEITEDLVADRLIRILDWETSPSIATDYYAYAAASDFIRDEIEDSSKQRDLREQAATLLMELKAVDLAESRLNMFNTQAARLGRVGRRPYKNIIRGSI